jgi:hypothetical protein
MMAFTAGWLGAAAAVPLAAAAAKDFLTVSAEGGVCVGAVSMSSEWVTMGMRQYKHVFGMGNNRHETVQALRLQMQREG